MKLIELLNKIANDEELPKKFIYEDNLYYLERDKCYVREFDKDIFENQFIFEDLNNEIEIIEEHKIPEKIKALNNVGNSSSIGEFKDKQQLNNNILKIKINEILDCLEEIK